MDPCETSKTLYNLFENCSKVQNSYIIFHNGLKKFKLSYEELRTSVQVVAHLLDVVSSHEVIACMCRPHVLQPVLMLGILKNSSAFAFLDSKSPLTSLENLEKHVSIRTLLAEEKTLESLKSPLCSCWETVKCVAILDTCVKVLHFSQNHCVSSQCAHKIRKSGETFICHNDLAYVIQTSGTTGEPKIVQVPHQCIVPNILDLRSVYGVTSKDVVLLCAPLTFDPSIVEIFLALNSSASLVIVSDYVKSISEKLAKVINECGVTIMQATPSLLHSCGTKLICNQILTEHTSLRVVCFGGERCPSLSKLSSWKSEGNKTQFYNIYGITEVSSWGTIEKIETGKKLCNVEIPLGKPLLDTDIEVRDENGEVIEEGHGQLFIGGSKRWCVLNDESWPLHPSRIMRPTGDWVYRALDGSLYFEGRQDSLIKYHGQKVFLCPLNKVIESKSEICSHSLYFNQSVGKLYVFLVLNENPCKKDTEDGIRHSILQALQRAEPNTPPLIITIVPFIPITAHGKVDFKSLLTRAGSNFGKSSVPSGRVSPDSVEKYIRVLWQDFTRNNSIEDNDNFVLNGGDSVSSVQLTLQMEQKFGVSLPGLLETVLNSTFKCVCEYVQQCLNGTYLDYGNCKRFKRDDELPLSTIPADSSHRVRSPPKISGSLSRTTLQFPIRTCFKMLTRREKKLKCFCGECFISETEPQQAAHKYELFLQEKFKFDLQKCIDASPCCCDFVGGRLIAFIGSHSGYFAAVDIEKGSAVWKQKLPDRIESSACLSSCGNFILVGCYDHSLYCFNSWGGDCVWKHKTNGTVKSSPTVSPKNIVYCGSHDHHLYALSVANAGSLIWKMKISNGSIFSSPALSVDNNSVYAATLDGVIASLHPDTGQILWKYSYTSPLFSSPLFVKSNIFIGSVDGSMLCFDESGELVRKYMATGPIFSSSSYVECPGKSCEASEDCIIFGSHGCLVYCYSIKGAVQWEFTCSSAVYATPFLFSKNGQCYVVVACTKGTVYILNAHAGNLLYSVNCSGELFSSPVVMNDYLVIGCRDNNLYCFQIKHRPSSS